MRPPLRNIESLTIKFGGRALIRIAQSTARAKDKLCLLLVKGMRMSAFGSGGNRPSYGELLGQAQDLSSKMRRLMWKANSVAVQPRSESSKEAQTVACNMHATSGEFLILGRATYKWCYCIPCVPRCYQDVHRCENSTGGEGKKDSHRHLVLFIDQGGFFINLRYQEQWRC